MKISIDISGASFTVDLSNPIDISIPLLFNEDQPNTYDVPRATSKPYEKDNWIGDTRRGGSCNFETITLNPHCNGTHTECVGHITRDRIAVNGILREALFPCTLVTVRPEMGLDTVERYVPSKRPADRLITRKRLADALTAKDPNFTRGLIIRTLPNEESKKDRRYSVDEPPFLSLDAIEWIESVGVEHLIVDVPSVDRALDDGKLAVHHAFWNVPQGTHHTSSSTKSITEMVFVPDAIADGVYIGMIQIPDFVSDAAPSRVWLYNIMSLNLTNH